MHPLMICQDLAALEAVREFTYDPTDRRFLAYFEARTGLEITRCECGLGRVVGTLANPAVPVPEGAGPWAYTRASLEDVWQIYRRISS